jgi:hypothetical protein
MNAEIGNEAAQFHFWEYFFAFSVQYAQVPIQPQTVKQYYVNVLVLYVSSRFLCCRLIWVDVTTTPPP